MTFPLGSLRGDGTDPVSSRELSTGHAPHWREQAALLIGAVVWLIALLALATHSAADPGFSTSGSGGPIHNRAGVFGAWLSDIGFFLAGYSVWWAIVVGARAWLGALARTLRSHSGAAPQGSAHALPGWTMWLGLAMLLAASASLEWTRLYQWEGQVAGGNAGGVIGLVLGRASQNLLGFAGSGVLWIAMLVAGASLALRFSWLRVADALGAAIESLRTRRVERIERAEDARLGAEAIRERDEVLEVEHELHEQHLPIVIEPTLVDVPKSTRVVKERQKPLFSELVDTKLPQVDLLDSAPQRVEGVSAESLEMTSRLIEKRLKDFGVEVRVVAASPGPVITRYEIERRSASRARRW